MEDTIWYNINVCTTNTCLIRATLYKHLIIYRQVAALRHHSYVASLRTNA